MKSVGFAALILTASLLAWGSLSSSAQEQANTAAPKPATRRAPAPETVKAMKDGIEAMRRGDWKLAAESWSQCVKIDPDNAGAWANLGKVQLQLKDTAAAT